jgi:hypothetical protein
MGNIISLREPNTWWSVSSDYFEIAVKRAMFYFMPYLEKTSPDLAEYYQTEFIYTTGMGLSMDDMTMEEEKYFLEALKLSYQDKEIEAKAIPKDSEESKYYLNFLVKFQELLCLIENEIKDIERGKLVLQPNGIAIINEQFSE